MNTPGYLQDQGTIGLGTDNSTLSNLPNPIEGAAKPFGGFDEGIGRGLEGLLGSSSPLIKGTYELASGRDPFTGRDVSTKAPNWLTAALPSLTTTRLDSNGKEKHEVNPLLNILLQNLPTSRAGSTLDKLLDEKTTLADGGLNFLTGLKVNRFDPELERTYQQADQVARELDGYASQGMLKKSKFGYAPEPAARGHVPPRASMLLRKYNVLRQKARQISAAKVRTQSR